MAEMDTATKLDQAISFITQSRQDLHSGNVVLLEGFQHKVREICLEIERLPKEEMLQFSAKLDKLATGLNILEKELREQQTKVQQDIFALNRKQSALKTYQTVSHSSQQNGEGE